MPARPRRWQVVVSSFGALLSIVGFAVLWSWSVRAMRTEGGGLATVLAYGIPCALFAGLWAGVNTVRRLRNKAERMGEQPRAR